MDPRQLTGRPIGNSELIAIAWPSHGHLGKHSHFGREPINTRGHTICLSFLIYTFAFQINKILKNQNTKLLYPYMNIILEG